MTLVFASHNLGQVKRLATPGRLPGAAAACWPTCRCMSFSMARWGTSHEADLFVKGELA